MDRARPFVDNRNGERSSGPTAQSGGTRVKRFVRLSAIHDGEIHAGLIQYPDRIGRMTMETILRYSNGEETEKEVLTPTSLFLEDTPDDA